MDESKDTLSLRNAILTCLFLASLESATTACGNAGFAGSSGSQSSKVETQKNASTSDLNAVQPIDSNCISKIEAPKFSCENIAQSRGGLRDVVVGVKVILLPSPAPFERGKASCKAFGGELLADGDFFVDAIYNCIGATGNIGAWVDNTSESIYKYKSMSSIEAKYGSQIKQQCFKNIYKSGFSLLSSPRQYKKGFSTIKSDGAEDEKKLRDIFCVFNL